MPVLITGGARSGKSRFAERYASCLGAGGVYVATSRIWDEEMRERAALHRADREQSGFPWETVEEPLDLAGLLERLDGRLTGEGAGAAPLAFSGPTVILVDCMTLWLTNVLLAEETGEWTGEARERAARTAERELDRLVARLRRMNVPVLLVSNEVGDGIVPEYPLGRLFRDLAGRMNQRLADVSEQVFLVTAGIPVELKSRAFRLPPPYGAGGTGRGAGPG